MKIASLSALFLVAGTAIAHAQTPLEIATASGVCGEVGVLSASVIPGGTDIQAVCNGVPFAFLPAGGAAAVGGLLLVAVLNASGGTVSTGTTNSTN